MNQKKAKAIRRTMKKIHGYTKSTPAHPVQIAMVPIAKIFTEGKYRRAYKIEARKLIKQLRKMGVVLPLEVFMRRIDKVLPDVGAFYHETGRTESKRAVAAPGRSAYKAEKKQYVSLKKKQRSGRY